MIWCGSQHRHGQRRIPPGELAAVQDLLASFDRVFAVLEDNDAEKLQALAMPMPPADWATRRSKNLSPSGQARAPAPRFCRSDRIRKNSPSVVYFLEDAKDGSVRWKRKEVLSHFS